MRTTLSISYFGGQSSLPMSLSFPNRLRNAGSSHDSTRMYGVWPCSSSQTRLRSSHAGSSPAHDKRFLAAVKPHGAAVPDRQDDGIRRQPIADDEACAAIPLLEKFQIEREPIVGRAHAEDARGRGDAKQRSTHARRLGRADNDHGVNDMNGHRACQHAASTQSPAGETARTTTHRRACTENRSRRSRE